MIGEHGPLVQQVRHALRPGPLKEGDRLPRAKEVAKRVAVNPNAALKEYRELEHDGLVAARPGAGTFVTRALGRSGKSAPRQAR